MGGHSDSAVTQQIKDDQALTAKLQDITAQLEQDLAADFQRLLGVPLPVEGQSTPIAVDVQNYDLVSTETSVADVITEYDDGATSAVDVAVQDPTVRTSALAVVQSLLGFVQEQGEVAVGGYATSATSPDSWLAAVVCEVDFGDHEDWGTPVDFFIIMFAFVVWLPSPTPPTGTAGSHPPTRPRDVRPCHWSR